jgi:hypothetical protein
MWYGWSYSIVASASCSCRHRIAAIRILEPCGSCRLHHESICVVRLEGDPAAFEISGRKGFEVEDLGEVRWWSMGELLVSGEQFYPMSLAAVLPRVLAGEQVEEALETWP